jgi:hypothetical protein
MQFVDIVFLIASGVILILSLLYVMQFFDIVFLVVVGGILILSLMPGWNPKWKRVWNGLLLPGLWLWLTIDAVSGRDRLKIVIVFAVWLIIAWPYMKRLWKHFAKP